MLVLGAVSCRRADQPVSPDPGKEQPDPGKEQPREHVAFTVQAFGYATKGTDNSLSEGDAVGLFAAQPVGAVNVKATVSGRTLSPVTAVQWGQNQTEATRFLSYMPYVADLTGTSLTFSVQANQESYAAYAASDLRLSSEEGVPGKTVHLIYRHALSKLTVIPVCEDRKEQVTAVQTGKLTTGVEVNLTDRGLSAKPTQAQVKLGKAVVANGNKGFTAILVPQNGLLPLQLTLDSGRTVDCKLETPATLESGCAYKAEIRVPAGAKEVSFRLSVTDWLSGGTLPYESTDDD